ncbi:MAG TPA: hypothetical protein EYP60_07770 [bacterium (Candidatus Stahlbacteria)]|nr:hypothetical protein [Candidatus Stahlbacteria bacterium]
MAIVLLLVFYSASLPQSSQTIQVQFERQYSEKSLKETVKGNIYYQAPGRITVVVTYPVKQWMIFEGKQLIIYYPDDKQAFQINAQFPISLPFFEALIGVVKIDYGLTDIGYVLSNYKTRADTLFTYWSPSKKKTSKALGEFTLAYVSDKIVYAELKKRDGTTISKSFYKNHIRCGTTYFPLEIYTIRYTKKDSTFEKVVYTNPQFDKSFPPEVTNFKIPTNVKIEEINW